MAIDSYNSRNSISNLESKLPYQLAVKLKSDLTSMFSDYFRSLIHQFGASANDLNPDALLNECIKDFVELVFKDDYFLNIDPHTGMIDETSYDQRVSELINIFTKLGVGEIIAENNIRAQLLEHKPVFEAELIRMRSELSHLQSQNSLLTAELNRLRIEPSHSLSPATSLVRNSLIDMANSHGVSLVDSNGSSLAERLSDILDKEEDLSFLAVDISNIEALIPNPILDRYIGREAELSDLVERVLLHFSNSLKVHGAKMDVFYMPGKSRFLVPILSPSSNIALLSSLHISDVLKSGAAVRKSISKIIEKTETRGSEGSSMPSNPSFRTALLDVSPANLRDSVDEMALIYLNPEFFSASVEIAMQKLLRLSNPAKPGVYYNNVGQVTESIVNSGDIDRGYSFLARIFENLVSELASKGKLPNYTGGAGGAGQIS